MAKHPKVPTIEMVDAAIINQADPKNVNGRLYDAISILLDNFEDMTVREQVATVAAIARIQVLFIKLREERDEPKSEPARDGIEVKRFAKAFAANANRRRKSVSRKNTAIATADDLDSDQLEY